jgi:hypothetical protein
VASNVTPVQYGLDIDQALAECTANPFCNSIIQESRGAKGPSEVAPKNAPRGTKPIDQTGLSRGEIHDIKDGLQAGANEWVGIAPNGDVITTDPLTGNALNLGNFDVFLN